MDFDANKFIYIVSWCLAIGATIGTLLGLSALYYFHNTASGKLDLLRMRLNRQVPQFRWWMLFAAILGWIAVFSFS